MGPGPITPISRTIPGSGGFWEVTTEAVCSLAEVQSVAIGADPVRRKHFPGLPLVPVVPVVPVVPLVAVVPGGPRLPLLRMLTGDVKGTGRRFLRDQIVRHFQILRLPWFLGEGSSTHTFERQRLLLEAAVTVEPLVKVGHPTHRTHPFLLSGYRVHIGGRLGGTTLV